MMQQIVLLILISGALSAQLPSGFQKCERKKSDFQQCLTKAIENAIHQLNKPFPQFGVPSFDPLEIPEVYIPPGNGPTAFGQDYINLKLRGVTSTTCSKSDLNFDTKILKVWCSTPEIHLEFDYIVEGKILVLPIHGKGTGTVRILNPSTDLVLNLEEFERDGKKYFRTKSFQYTLTPKKIIFDLKNLFDGDKLMGDNVLAVMNENWSDLFRDVKPHYEQAFGKFFENTFNGFFDKISIDEAFGSE